MAYTILLLLFQLHHIHWTPYKSNCEKNAFKQSTALQLKQSHASTDTYLAQREVVKKGWGTVRLPKGESRGVAGDFEASTTVLGCNLGLECPPVLWVRVQSLEKGDNTEIIYQKNQL